ncbi:MAG: FHA domain-containing protein [Anaerolineales bacterium]|nr:FHA domain-containing protein [Anaerolineales bacterium]
MASQIFQLVMGAGPHPGKVYELTQGELTIGRDISNNIVINDPEVSRRHARLTAQAGAYVIEDLGSTNGTFVDGQRLIGPHTLRSGETIMFGEKVSLKYEQLGYDPNATLIGASAAAPAPPPSRDTYRIPPFEEEKPYAPAPPQEMYAAPQQDYQPAPIPRTEYVPPEPEYQPAYSGQVPPGPAQDMYAVPAEPYAETYGAEYEEEDKKKKTRTWILAGCGCLLVLICICAIGAYAFDAANLYCEAPFDILFGDLLGLCE